MVWERSDRQDDTDRSNDTNLSRREALQWTATGIGGAGLFTGTASATEDFVNVLGINLSDYPQTHAYVNVNTPYGSDGWLRLWDFDVIEDGDTRSLDYVRTGISPVDIVFVVDATEPMRYDMDSLPLVYMYERMLYNEIDARFGLVTFNQDSVTKDVGLTDEIMDLVNTLEYKWAADLDGCENSNLMAIQEAKRMDFRSDAQKVIIHISPAEPSYSGEGSDISDITFADAAADIENNGVLFFSVQKKVYDHQNHPCAAAWGQSDQPYDPWDPDPGLSGQLAQITKVITHSYDVAYRTSTLPGESSTVRVVAEDQYKGTGETTMTLKIPSHFEAPDVNFDQLKGEKLDLADRISYLSGGTIDETAEVNTVIDKLVAGVQDGTISRSEASDTLERMKLGEQVTERILEGAGGGTPDGAATDYDIAGTSARSAIDGAFSSLLSLLPLSKIARKIPFGGAAIRTAKKWAKKGVKRIIETALSKAGSLSRFVRRETDAIANDIYDEVESEALGNAASVVGEKQRQAADLNDDAADILLGLIEADTSELLGATDLSEGLDWLNTAATPATSFQGSVSGASDVASNAISDANQEFQETNSSFETFNDAFDIADIAGYVIDIATVAGLFTGGILSVIAALGGVLLQLATAALKLLKAGIGFLSLTRLRDIHTDAVGGIIAGGAN